VACENYACGPDGCKRTCTADNDCAIDFYCERSECLVRCPIKSNDNVVSNAGFDRGVWTHEIQNATWSSIDATNCPTSGSGRVNASGTLFSDCFAVTPGRNYFFGYMLKGEELDPTFHGCLVAWLNDTCVEPVTGGTGVPQVQTVTSWQKLQGTLTAPPTATRGRVMCANFKIGGTSYFLVDRVFFNAKEPQF
jgi:hypothetical protein